MLVIYEFVFDQNSFFSLEKIINVAIETSLLPLGIVRSFACHSLCLSAKWSKHEVGDALISYYYRLKF
jgi:hypothetical protein